MTLRPRVPRRTRSSGGVLLVVAVAAIYTAAVDRRTAGHARRGRRRPSRSADRLDRGGPTAAGRGPGRLDAPGRSSGRPTSSRRALTADPSFYDRRPRARSPSRSTCDPTATTPRSPGRGPGQRPARLPRGRRPRARRRWRSIEYARRPGACSTDARTQLGDYAGATDALSGCSLLQPGLASFTRASYDAELHGDVAGARSALEQALDDDGRRRRRGVLPDLPGDTGVLRRGP